MKTKFTISIILLFLLPISCTREKKQIQAPISQIDINTLTFSHSMKGWELYSWPDGNGWRYSILIGTNRLKTYDEIISNEIQVADEDSLKMILEKFPENEMISWFGSSWLEQTWSEDSKNLSLPPEQIITNIKQFCNQNKLQLQIVE